MACDCFTTCLDWVRTKSWTRRSMCLHCAALKGRLGIIKALGVCQTAPFLCLPSIPCPGASHVRPDVCWEVIIQPLIQLHTANPTHATISIMIYRIVHTLHHTRVDHSETLKHGCVE